MTVRRITRLFGLLAVLWLAGCGREDKPTMIAETDEPLYLEAQALKRQGRNPEALMNFLKVIEQRGEQFAGESHLEAGLIYLQHNKDYIEAIHHFKKYLLLEPNSWQAPRVRELVDTAKREFVRTLPLPPPDITSEPKALVELQQLRQENAELRAQIATLRGGNAVVPRNRAVQVLMPSVPTRTEPAAIEDSPLAAMPAPTEPTQSVRTQPAPQTARATLAPAASGRVYRVRPGDTLFGIARQLTPTEVGKKVAEIVEANRHVLPDGANTPLHTGMELRLP